jgi:hypothetical protein
VAKTSLYFIKNEDKTKFIRQFPQTAQITRLRLYNANVLENRFRNQSPNRVFLTNISHRFKIVEIDAVDKHLMLYRDPRTDGSERIFSRRHPWTYLTQGRHEIT